MIDRLRTALQDTYLIERELGGGGMSRVFLAEERALGRRVVIKALPPEIAAGISAERFRREIQLAASLQHPHIVPVLATGEADGVLWYSMPHVEGQSLRALLERSGPVPAETAVRLLRDIADALEHAHTKGIVHRDIKPENILLSGNHALVTDFGIAKALATARQTAPGVTTEGLVIGTPAYMAPEQAAGDSNLDHRADVYALGAVGYEMLVGTPVFARSSPQALIAAHIAEPPVPLEKLKPSVPSRLSQLIMFCLAKEPARRPTAFAVRTTLETLEPRALSSRLRQRLIAIAGLIVLLGVTSVATGFWPRRSLLARGLLSGRDRILVAEILNRTGDSTLGLALTQALRVDLSQSDIIRVVGDQEIRDGLARMRETSGAPLNDSLSRELAQREGIKAIVASDITPVGDGFVLTARIIAPSDGAELTAVREDVGNERELLDALGNLSHEMRRRIGESLRSLAATASLERVTTHSLDALRKYSLGIRVIDVDRDLDRGRALLEEAIALDSGFAMAWRKLGIQLANEGQRARSVRALTAAFRHRDRLVGTERAWTEASYYGTVTFQTDRAIQTYRAITESDPFDWRALNNLALMHLRNGRLDMAESLLRRAVTLDSTGVNPRTILVEVLINRGKLSQADSLLRATLRIAPHDVAIGFTETALRYQQRGGVAAESTLPRILALDPSSRSIRRWVAESRAALAALRGGFREASRQFQLARREALAADDLEAFFDQVSNEAALSIIVERKPAEGIALMERELEAHPISAIEELDRPYLEYAYNYAVAGERDKARAMLTEFERISPDLRRGDEPNRLSARAMLALSEMEFDQALDYLDQITRLDLCPTCVSAERALIWDQAGKPDSAIAEYEKFLGLKDPDRVWTDAFYLPNVLRRLGRLYEERDDAGQALRYYGRLVELWREADPELQPRVGDIRDRMTRLSGEP